MNSITCVVFCAVVLPIVVACGDDGPGPVPPPVPVGLMWGSGASGAMVEDTVQLAAFYYDSANDPIGAPRPIVTWSSSNPAVIQILSESLAVALDTGQAVLTATTTSVPIDTLEVAFEVIPRWHGRLVWARQPNAAGQPGMAVLEFPGHEVRQLPELGYPGDGSGDPYLTSDGRYLAAIAARPISAIAPKTIFVVDLVTGTKTAPFDSLPGNQLSPVWFPGDTLLAFLAVAPTGFEVFSARVDGSQRQQRTHLGQPLPPFFDLTPDGNLILPLIVGGTIDLFETTLAGDTVRRLTSTVVEEATPAVSPDGALIAYTIGSHVWMMNRDGSNVRRLLPNRRQLHGSGPPFHPIEVGSTAPSWSPDGQFVLLNWAADAHWTVQPPQSPSQYVALTEVYAIRWQDGLAVRLTRMPLVDAQPVFR